MRISFVVAMAKNGVIGRDNSLPWRLPADMRRFRAVTMGKPVIMGRKTYESIPAQFRPLPGRRNVVLTRNAGYQAEGATVVHSVEEALAAAGDAEEVMVIGGAELFEQLLPQAERLYLTLIDAVFEGDVYFPNFDWDEWTEASRESFAPDEKNPYPYTFLVLDRH